MDVLHTGKLVLTFNEDLFPVAIDQRLVMMIRSRNREDFIKAYIKDTWVINGKPSYENF